LLRKPCAAFPGPNDLFEILALRIARGQIFGGEATVVDYDREQIVEVVRDATCQLAHRLHLLRLRQYDAVALQVLRHRVEGYGDPTELVVPVDGRAVAEIIVAELMRGPFKCSKGGAHGTQQTSSHIRNE
jgi:hypothetical protein